MIKPTNPKIFTPQDGSCVLDLDCRNVVGSRVFDRSGKGNHGAITGAVVKPINYGLPVLDFDGTDDKINCGNDESLEIIDKKTIEILIRPDVFIGYRDILNKGNSANRFTIEFGNSLNWYFYLGVGDVGQATVNFDPVVLGRFFYLVVTIDNSNSIIKTYTNGKFNNFDSSFTLPNTSGQSFFVAGSEVSNISVAFVSMLNRVVSASEISQRFQNIRHIYGI